MPKLSPMLAAPLVATLLCAACSAGGADEALNNGYYPSPGQNNTNNTSNNSSNNNTPYEPEPERDYAFSQPAVFGEALFVANETLNSVVWIDSRALTIRTIPVGFRPTKIVGPSVSTPSQAARVYVLNEGNSSVSVIDPAARLVLHTLPVLARANALAASPDGSSAIAWYDDAAAQPNTQPGDLSAVTIIRDGAAHQIAVGFHVRRVQFTEDGAKVLVISDDGISVITLDQVSDDQLAIPVPALPPALQELAPLDLEIQITRDGRYALTRTTAFPGLVSLDLDANTHTLITLPETPTDIDLVERAGEREALVMLRRRAELVRITIPTGFAALAEAQALQPLAGGADMGLDMGEEADLDSDDMAHDEDMSFDMSIEEDMGDDPGDMGAPAGPLPEVEGVTIVALDAALGLAAVSGDGEQAFLYSALGGERRAALLGLGAADGALRPLLLEKGVLGVLPDEAGQTFLVLHDREPGELPQGATPGDPEFVARSWGVSAVDVASGISRLVLTELEPGGATLWSEQGAAPRAYLIFEAPASAALATPAHRDVVEINLVTFGVDSLRVPSLPEAIGPVPGTGRVYISQEHPRGRMTFLDVLSRKRQTVTGYQLNAGID